MNSDYKVGDLIYDAKLLQKSEMRKDIVIELSYKGFGDRKSTRLNSSHGDESRMPSSA